MSDLSLYEKVSDVYEKVRGVTSIAIRLLPGGPFQMGDEKVRGVTLRVFKTLPPNLHDYYNVWFTEYAKKDWLVYRNERYSYGEVMRQYLALGAELKSSFNIKPGDKVGICMRNYPEFLIAFLGITAMGAVAVPLNSLWKTEELQYAVNDSGCRLIIADPERVQLCLPFANELSLRFILCRGENWRSKQHPCSAWDDVLSAGARKPIAHPGSSVQPESEAMIMYTSGSTGFPKGVVHTQRSVGTAIKVGELSALSAPDPDGVQLMAVPLFHITALMAVGLLSIPAGTKIVMMRKWDAGRGLDIIEREKVTRFTGVPTMMRDLLEHPNFSPKRVESLRGVVAGGAPVPPTQVSRMREKAKNVNSAQGYGLTETMALGTINRGVDYLQRPTSCGRPIPLLVTCVIKDPATGEVLPDGQRGEVCLKGAMVMKGYHNKPEATRKAIDSEGFFHTGDIGKMEGGFLYILDRLKDLIIRGGENIDCSEVEAALTSHTSVRECSVFGLPDARLGEVVGAAVWLTDENVTKDEILSSKGVQKLAKFKVPRKENIFIYNKELPKGATGKIDKKGMRKKFSEIVGKRQLQARL
eukprot:g6104.t1